MIFDNPAELKERIESLSGRRVYREPDIFKDTSSFMSILGGNVLRLGGNDFFVLGDTWEGRFGIDDQPKFWVKYAVDLTTGDKKIVKLVFSEEFETDLGFIKVRHRRSPEKESAIIELVQDNPRFMQGYTVTDSVGNQVRVIDFIRGKSLYVTLPALDMTHEEYFHEHLPGVMKELIACIEALAALHAQEQHHGDVRSDHILIEHDSRHFIWIDFDYSVNYSDYDIWSMGNVITFVVGKGIHTFDGVTREPKSYPLCQGGFVEDDALPLAKHRVANLRKLFPYIPKALNDILMRFSVGSIDFYENLESPAADLRAIFP
jgi:hypothetical protein